MNTLEKNPKCAVYQHLDADGRILYIGVSINPMARFGQHRGCSPWVLQVATITVEWFDSQAAAYAEERRLVAIHQPPMNRHMIHRKGFEPEKLAQRFGAA